MRPSTVVVFDGQSLNIVPNLYPYPHVAMAGRSEPWHIVGHSGISWTVLSSSASSRTDPHAAGYDRAVLVMAGGQSDIYLEGNSGAQAYADMVTYATARRAAGFDRIIFCTAAPAVWFANEPYATAWSDFNTLVLDAANQGDCDAVIDFNSDPRLADHTDLTYYFADELHWNTAGAAVAGGIAAPVVAAVLATL